jgi:hypothetical protein
MTGIILISTIFFLLLWSLYFHFWRNDLVYKYRISKLINDGFDAYDALPSYSYMVFHPVEWSDIRLMRKDK